MYIKTISKVSKKVKIIRHYLTKSNICLYSLIKQSLGISSEKNGDVTRTQGVRCVVKTFFGSSLDKL